MAGKVRVQGEKVRRFILEQVEKHPEDIASLTSKKFGITRQAVNKHLQRLAQQSAIVRRGSTRVPKYQLSPISSQTFHYDIKPGLAEDVVWTLHIRPALGDLPDNVLNIWHHGFTEMFNNAIDHSAGKNIWVQMEKTPISTETLVAGRRYRHLQENSIGAGLVVDGAPREIRAIQRQADYGSTKPLGEGIFFTSRMLDKFDILSGGVFFNHKRDAKEDWMLERASPGAGTAVFLNCITILHEPPRRCLTSTPRVRTTALPRQLFRSTSLNMALTSSFRGLRPNVCWRACDLFKKVVLDFKDVGMIGQPFADQIFRVFASAHPDIELIAINVNKEIRDMIARAKSHSTLQVASRRSDARVAAFEACAALVSPARLLAQEPGR